MERLIHSAKFWTAVFDLIASLAMYFVGKYTAAGEDMKFVIAAIQPVFLAVIGGIAWEDYGEKSSMLPQDAEG